MGVSREVRLEKGIPAYAGNQILLETSLPNDRD